MSATLRRISEETHGSPEDGRCSVVITEQDGENFSDYLGVGQPVGLGCYCTGECQYGS